MKRKTIHSLLSILGGILAAELIFVGVQQVLALQAQDTLQIPPTTINVPSAAVMPEPTTVPPTTIPPTTIPPVVTEAPEPEHYTLTFLGDCTLGSDPDRFLSGSSFVYTVGDNYDYPFQNVREYLENDDFTIANLESVLADSGKPIAKRFVFRGPEAYSQILTGSSVEAVTLANNHTEDFGVAGYANTKRVLEESGVAYVEEDKTAIYVTEGGLVIGLYADAFDFTVKDIQDNISLLWEQGAEIVICAFHWGTEGSYRHTNAQETYARAAIDAGADIVYGHHPHVLQEIEEYNDGIIFYSLGNFSFGGNTSPRDMDSAILQMDIIRDENGLVRMGSLTVIPVSISSVEKKNNYQPTPYEPFSEAYYRVLSKLDGTFEGEDLVVNYN